MKTFTKAAYIFLDDGSNAYDVNVFGYEENLTQDEYDNFRRFVSNGGIIVFLRGNIFYAEVSHDEDRNTVTLVIRHLWEFDGKAARKSIAERWFKETRECIGSNFWQESIDKSNTLQIILLTMHTSKSSILIIQMSR